ncbi:MAG: AMMECR1 domain-containing protein [Candidatus Andersenbacteria bacterium]|nr:AMMECR1 domain-containing protein [bacterium]MDZ4225541.1 AMMECR1 domain-containing protein [Candidatus Andersenbacteria bacterium]
MYGKLAKQAAEYLVKSGNILPFPGVLLPDLRRQRACYVSIIENPGRRLRSMSGSVLPQTPNLAAEIIHNTSNALSACRITRPDLPNLRYSVALLGTLQRISDPSHLNPSLYGLYVTSDRGKSALLLPNRAGIETADDQIATALREAGILTRYESYSLYRFDVSYDDA